MKILLVAHSDAPWTPRYARGLQQRGHELRVLTQHPGAVPGVETIELGDRPQSMVGQVLRLLSTIRCIRAQSKRFAPDVIFAPFLTTNALAVALSGCRPLVVSARGSDVEAFRGESALRRWLRPKVVRFTTRRASRVHAVSQSLAIRLGQYGVPDDQIDRFCVGVDLDRFPLGSKQPDAVPRIVSIRKHDPRYDLGTLIQSLSELRDRGLAFEAVLAGSGPLLEAHRERIHALRLGDRVSLPGELSHAACGDLLRNASIYVSTSLTDGASSSTLEAMASGPLPVLARIDANQHWVTEGENALLFEPGNVHELTRSLQRGLDDSALRERARGTNRARVERDACFESNLSRLEALLSSAVSGEVTGNADYCLGLRTGA